MGNTEFTTVLNWFEREFINKNYLFLLLFHFKKICYNLKIMIYQENSIKK